MSDALRRLALALIVGLVPPGAAATLRADEPPAEAPVAPEDPADPLSDMPPAPADAPLPAWLEPGARVTYFGGATSLPGIRETLEEEEGDDDARERRWKRRDGSLVPPPDFEAAAGAGFTEYDVVAVNARAIGVTRRTLIFADARMQSVLAVSIDGLVGDRDKIADAWKHPARLRALVEERKPGRVVRRGSYPLDGRDHDAVTVRVSGEGGYFRYTFDLDTGLLLVFSSSTIDETRNLTRITNVRLRGVRKRGLPWAARPMPAWLARLGRMEFAGTQENSLGAGMVPPWKVSATVTIGRWVGDCGIGEYASTVDFGYGRGETTKSPQVYGPARGDPLGIDPAILAKLEPGTKIDEDPITRRVLRVAARDARHASIVEEGPLDGTQYVYETTRGQLVAITARQQQGPALLTVDLRVTGVR